MLTESAPKPAENGLFIVFEGGDGAGKSTQVALLEKALKKQGRTVVVTREPGGTELGAQIRQLLLHGGDVAPRAEALLYAADRAHHIETVVKPALAEGKVVIQDRYIDSSVAYQGAGRDLGADDIRALSNWATAGLTPHLTVLLDVDPAAGKARREGRAAGDDRIEREAEEFHNAVRDGFLKAARNTPERYLVIDAVLPIEEIHTQVFARVSSF